MKQNEEAGEWIAEYDGEEKSVGQVFGDLIEKLDAPTELPVRLMLERDMIHAADLNRHELPSFVHLVPSFEDAFEPVDLSLLNYAPQTTAELYDMMKRTADLCGKLELTPDGEFIFWHLYETARVELSVNSHDCFVGVTSLLDGKEVGITHWHPTEYAIYYEVCKMGKRGSVLVLRQRDGSGAVLYSGKKEDCPYKPDKKILFGKYYYIEAK